MKRTHCILNVKTAIVLLLSFLATSCEKPEEPVKQHDTEYGFARGAWDILQNTDPIKASVDSMQVKNVYLVPKGSWERGNIHNIINQKLLPALQISPKVKGKGNFEDIGVSEADSLLLVSLGYTVNQK